MDKVIGFFIAWKGVFLPLAALAMFALGWTVQGWRCDAAKAKAERAAAKASAQMQAHADDISLDYETDRSQGYAASQDRQERVRIIYRDSPVSDSCAVPDDARSVLVEAVRSANTGSAK